jgi:hypothetical protein
MDKRQGTNDSGASRVQPLVVSFCGQSRRERLQHCSVGSMPRKFAVTDMSVTDMDFLFSRPLVAPWKEAAQYALAEECVARAQRGSPPPPRARPGGALKAPQIGGWTASPWEGAGSSARGDTLSSPARVGDTLSPSARAVDERSLERGRQARLKQQRDVAHQQALALEARRVKQQHQAVGDNALRGRGWREVPGVRGGSGGRDGRGRSASPARGAVHSARSGSPAGGAAAGARPPSARDAAAATRAAAAAAVARAAAAVARAATPEAMARARAAARDAAGSIWAEQVALWRGLRRWCAAAARRRRRQLAVAIADRAAPLHAQRTRRAARAVQSAWRARQVRAR